MKISEVIARMKDYHQGYRIREDTVVPIDEETTKDKILFGDPNAECTGIVTTCWANIRVIEKAAVLGANLIICHEALFWNHGDRTEWLEEQKNRTYLYKKALLEKYKIVVWRDHEHIHSGIPLADGTYVDGIFYGLAEILGWTSYIDRETSQRIDGAEGWHDFSLPGKLNPLSYQIPETTTEELARSLIGRLGLNGVKVIGDPGKRVSRISVPFHVLGEAKKEIALADEGKIDCFLAMELVDFTLAEYVRDADLSGDGIAIIGMGHFNIEEPGMQYMTKYIPKAIGEEIPCTFVQSGDTYQYITKNKWDSRRL